jgi:hypothetical protein
MICEHSFTVKRDRFNFQVEYILVGAEIGRRAGLSAYPRTIQVVSEGLLCRGRVTKGDARIIIRQGSAYDVDRLRKFTEEKRVLHIRRQLEGVSRMLCCG